MAFALFERADARFGLLMFTDTLATNSLVRALSIERRLAHPDTLRLLETADMLARFLTERGAADSALTILAGARAVCHHGFVLADSVLGVLWITTGSAYRVAERNELAIAAFDSARAIRTRILGPNHPGVAEALTDAGLVYSRANQLDQADATLHRALAIFEQAPGYEFQLAATLGALASVQYHSGDVVRSIETLERQVSLYARIFGPSSPRVITPLYNIGIRLFDFGDYAEANAIFTPLIPRCEASFGPGQFRTETIRYMAGASALRMGDTTAAERHLTRARAALLSRPMDQNHISDAIEVFYAPLLVRRGDLGGARRVLAEGLAREHATRAPLPDALMQLLQARANAQMASFDTLGLDSTLHELAERFGDSSHVEGAYHGEYLRMATLAEAWRGQRDRAWRDALASEEVDRAQLLRNVQALPDTRSLELEGSLSESLDPLISLSVDRGEPAVAAAWDGIVRRRGLVVAELAQRRLPRAALTDTALAGAHTRWVRAVRRYARLEVEGADESATDAARIEEQRAERSFSTLAQIRGLARDSSAVSLARIRSALRSDQALVSIVETAARTDSASFVAFATVGPGGRLRRAELGRVSDLTNLIDPWRSGLEMPPRAGAERRQEAACRRVGALVRRRTWDRLAPLIAGARTVVIVADGALADLPWQALPVNADRYLVEAGPEIETPGAERELLMSRPNHGHGLLALGSPDFNRAAPSLHASEDDEEPALAVASIHSDNPSGIALVAAAGLRGIATGCSDSATISLPALPGALAEVNDIARDWNATHPHDPATVVVGAQGSESAFRADAPGHEVLHIATHGIVWGEECRPVHEELRGVGGLGSLTPAKRAPRRPNAAASSPPPSPSPWTGRRVWLALAGANHARSSAGDPNDGLLTAEEIATLDLSDVDWVVLSACQSGVGLDWPLEGSVGMRRAFRLAGAHTVIASQWSISDRSTREWMRALYAARASGQQSAGGAIRAACREVLASRRRAGLDTHPFRWAAFTATGL
ncbi:MAG TPA: CHAT domain-containing tetratricopeptide repeat protein [Candidatus Udaeobacter sp.]|nr:CHAT domain-containing tetratricopeptide repeat protein [Candidatus Udaeobacter sp.]